MAKLVSKIYGEALYEIAMESRQPTGQELLAGVGGDRSDGLLAEVQQVSEILRANPEFDKLMLHPGIPQQDKVQMLENVFKGRVSDELVGLMRIVVQKEHYGDLQDIFRWFIDKVKETKGIGMAYVTSAAPLTKEQQAAVLNRLFETTSYRQIETEFKVDESLIGGMVIRINDRVVDSSVRTKLDDLTRQLLKIQLG